MQFFYICKTSLLKSELVSLRSHISGGFKFKICGFIQYFNLTGTTIGYTIAASISMMWVDMHIINVTFHWSLLIKIIVNNQFVVDEKRAIKRASCFHEKGHDHPCGVSGTPYMVLFGAVEILLSQLPNFHEISWLSMVAAVMSFTYSAIGLGLGIAKFARMFLMFWPFIQLILNFVSYHLRNIL